MEVLRDAASSLKKSPRLMRKKICQLRKGRKGKHLVQSIDDEVVFCVKKLGDFIVTGNCEVSFAKDGMRKAFEKAKRNRIEEKKKLNDLFMTISSEKIMIEDAETKELLNEISLERISNWLLDESIRQIFSFVVQSDDSVMRCNVFITRKMSQAEEIVRAICEAFRAATTFKEDAKIKQQDMVEDELERDAKGLYSEIGSATSKGNQGEGAASSFNARPVVTGSNFSIFEKINGDLNSDDDEQDASASMEFIYRNLSVNTNEKDVAKHFNIHDDYVEKSASSLADAITTDDILQMEYCERKGKQHDKGSEDNLIQFD